MPIRTRLNSIPSRNYKTTFKPEIGTELFPKIGFNTIYGKPYFLRYLTSTFLIKTLLLL